MKVIVTNGQMGISGLDTNVNFSSKFCLVSSSFPISRNPIFSIDLRRKKVTHGRILCVSAQDALSKVDNGRFSEKQLEFQPTFDEYLKAMEFVRTGGEQKKPIKDDKGNDDLRKVSRVEDVQKDEERHGFGLKSDKKDWGRSKFGLRERGSRGLEKDMSKLDTMEGLTEKYGVGNTQGLDQHKLQNRGRSTSSSVDRRLGVDGGLKKIDGRKMKPKNWESKVGNADVRRPGGYGDSDVEKRLGSNRDLRGGVPVPKRNSTGMQNKELNSNGVEVTSRVNRVELRNNLLGNNKRVQDKNKFYRSDVDRKLGEFESNRSQTEENGVYRRSIEPKLGASDRVTGTNIRKFIYRNEEEREIDNSITSSRMEREKSYQSKSNPRSNGDAFKTKKFGSSRTLRHTRFDGDRTYTKDPRNETNVRRGKFTKDSKFLSEYEDDDDLGMERAAFKSFEVFTDIRGEPRVTRMEMEKRIEKLAKLLNGNDIDMPEWMFSKMMHSAKIKFSDHSILRVIQILGKLGNWRRVLQVIEWLQSRDRFKSYKSRYIYTSALDALGKAKRPAEALNVFHAMRKEHSSYPDLAAYHCIAVTLGQAGHTKELFDVIDCMRSPPEKKFKTGMLGKWDPRLEPDIVVYNAVLNACAKRKQWEGAFWVLQQLKQQGLQPSSTTYGLVMEVMLACEKYSLVHEFFMKVQKSSMPNSLNYRVLVNTLWREGKTDEAVFAVQDMERRGIVGAASLYYDLARCLCSAGRCQEALMQIDKICKVANKPLVVTYTGLIQACLDMGSVQNGGYIFKQMHKFCSPNLVTCNIMLKAYLEHMMFEDAKDLFQKMLDGSCEITSRNDSKSNVVPDSYTFNTMLDACAVAQKWDDFKNVYQEMLHRRYNFNAKRHLQMVLEACRAGKGELLEITWKHLSRSGRVPPPPIVKERFCMKLVEKDYPTAISCITSHSADELNAAFSETGWLYLFKVNRHRFQKDTLVRLVQELSNLIAGSAQPNCMVKNVITSCKQFIGTHMGPLETNSESQDSFESLVT